MDGVIYHGNRLLPGVREFVDWLQREKKDFLFLTNNSGKTHGSCKPSSPGWDWTLTRSILHQCPGHRPVYCHPNAGGPGPLSLGSPACSTPCMNRASPLTMSPPDYVIVGESSSYTYDNICRAVRCVQKAPGSLAPTAT